MTKFTIHYTSNGKLRLLSVSQKISSLSCYDLYYGGNWIATLRKDELGNYRLVSYKSYLSRTEVISAGKQIDSYKNSAVNFTTVDYSLIHHLA